MRIAEVVEHFDTAVERAAICGDDMMALAARLFPICRSITGPGVRETLDLLGATVPLERIRVPSGTQCFDWTVPAEWSVREAYIEDASGVRIVDFARNNLHLVSYSRPVRSTMPLSELRTHLHSLPERPTVIPYRTSYYRDDWGFCLTDDQLRKLPDGQYRVWIDSTLAPGHLDLAHASAGPVDGRDVLFTSYVCHPSMANNELSGPVTLAFLYSLLAAVPHLAYRYRFLLGPETIGSIAFLAREGDGIKSRLAAGYVLTCIGDDGPFTYKRSRRRTSLADRAAMHALRHVARDRPVQLLEFDPRDGSDERQYCSPGFDLPVGSLIRSIYGSYPEYHTSADDLTVISAVGLSGSLAACVRVAETLELARTFVRTEPHGEPQLGRHGLYPSIGGSEQIDRELARMLYVLNYADGHHDLIDIADGLDEPIWQVATTAGRLEEAGLIVEDRD